MDKSISILVWKEFINNMNTFGGSKTPFLFIIDFEQEQIVIQLLENEVLKNTKNWTKAELIEDWSAIELVEGEDSLDVWLRVLGQRIK